MSTADSYYCCYCSHNICGSIQDAWNYSKNISETWTFWSVLQMDNSTNIQDHHSFLQQILTVNIFYIYNIL